MKQNVTELQVCMEFVISLFSKHQRFRNRLNRCKTPKPLNLKKPKWHNGTSEHFIADNLKLLANGLFDPSKAFDSLLSCVIITRSNALPWWHKYHIICPRQFRQGAVIVHFSSMVQAPIVMS